MRLNGWFILLIMVVVLVDFTGGNATAATANRQIVLKAGGSELKDTSDYWPELKEPRLKRVSAIDDKIVDVQIVSPKTFYVLGKDFGSTSLMIWEKDLENPIKIDVVVLLDLTTLKQKLYELYPNQQIEVYASETGVVLSGTVSGPEVVEEIIRLTQNFLPKKAESGNKGDKGGAALSGAGITNLLRVGAVQQVMLEVKFAEVDRTSSRDWQSALGLINQNGNWSVGAGVNPMSGKFIKSFGPATTDFPGGVPQYDIGNLGQNGGALPNWGGNNPGSMLLNFAGNAANIFINIRNLTASLNLLENEGLARVLAEPRLVTLSGQEASFLAGGEFPIPVSQGLDQTTIEFKEFGVGLRFTPIVLSNGKINLHVAPSVSEISSNSIIPTGIAGASLIVPNLTTRKLETTVQLQDGQTLALAGLLQDSLRETVSKIPGLGDIPILGTLFRSSGFQHHKTDLLIAVTPHLVKPLQEGELSFPGEFLRPPNALEFYLMGKLENSWSHDDPSLLSHHAFTPSAATPQPGGMEGSFGQEAPTVQ
jgi:pilus assembly protein CpaC